MSYQDDNVWQTLTPELEKKYLKKAIDKLDSDYKKIRQFVEDNNICVPMYNPRGDRYYNLTVYDIAEKMWKADGYYNPPTTFTKIKEREINFKKEIGI